MFDTVYFFLNSPDEKDINFVERCTDNLRDLAAHSGRRGNWVTGKLYGIENNSLDVTVCKDFLRVWKGSLCKWFHGDNLQTMSRGDTAAAIDMLSAALHVDMSKADITRIDVAGNLLMRYPPDVYYKYLGEKRGAKRGTFGGESLYYYFRNGCLCFYDKLKECRKNKELIPQGYRGKNIFRYEQRYLGRVAGQLGVPRVTGGMLYEESFYNSLIDRWQLAYQSIQKTINEKPNLEAMTGTRELYKLGVVCLVQRFGGEQAMLDYIDEAAMCGKISPPQKHRLRKVIKDSLATKDELLSNSEYISELDEQISAFVDFNKSNGITRSEN